jgi:hypothetical protein
MVLISILVSSTKDYYDLVILHFSDDLVNEDNPTTNVAISGQVSCTNPILGSFLKKMRVLNK